MLKQWIVRRKQSRMSVDPNDPTMQCPVAHPEAEGMMASAEEVCKAWQSHFETDTWREDAKRSMRSVSAIYFHWAGEGAIERPKEDEQFDRLTGISSHYQYFMLREGEVLMRPYSCWCPACFEVAAAGPGASTRLSSDYMVRDGCTKAPNAVPPNPRVPNPLYEWRNASCRAKTGAQTSSPDKRARGHGHELAEAGLQPGQWVLVEAFCDPEDEMWLGKTVAFSDFGPLPSCCKRHDGGQMNVYGTRFNEGDYMIAVQWYERLAESGDGERREFNRGERVIDVINSSELRMVDVKVAVIGAFPVSEEADDGEALIKWELDREAEAEALTWCR
jgi:hypothetical protein